MTDIQPDSIAARYGAEGFGITHLPYGSFSTQDKASRLGVRIGDHVITVFDALTSNSDLRELVDTPNLDALLATDRPTWDQLRTELQTALSSGTEAQRIEVSVHLASTVTMHMPFTVADYVDFYPLCFGSGGQCCL
jgi:fumarylacetoacetase